MYPNQPLARAVSPWSAEWSNLAGRRAAVGCAISDQSRSRHETKADFCLRARCFGDASPQCFPWCREKRREKRTRSGSRSGLASRARQSTLRNDTRIRRAAVFPWCREKSRERSKLSNDRPRRPARVTMLGGAGKFRRPLRRDTGNLINDAGGVRRAAPGRICVHIAPH